MIESFELAVIGAGPAGMEAAVSAAGYGVKTVLIDSYPKPGGQYLMQLSPEFESRAESKTDADARKLFKHVNKSPTVKIFDTLVWGIFKEEDSSWLVALYGKDAPYYIQADNLVLANGTYDTPIAFPGWTIPGVITCGAALTLVKNQRVAPGQRAIISGTGPLLFAVAAHLIEAGVQVLAVCEANHLFPRGIKHTFTMLKQWNRLVEGAGYMKTILAAKTAYKTGWSVVEARGEDSVTQAVIARLDSKGNPVPGSQKEYDVDLVVSGYSLTPNTGLARMIDCEMTWQPQRGGWIPIRDENFMTSLPGVYIVGDGAGIAGAENARIEGKLVGAIIAVRLGHIGESRRDLLYNEMAGSIKQQQRFAGLLSDLFTPPPGLVNLLTDESVICRCEEVTLGQIKEALQNGARSIGEVKMLTRTGMGNCQGRMCERSAAAIVAQKLAPDGAGMEKIGYYSVRPPLHPLPQSFLARADPDREGEEEKPLSPAE